MASRAPHRVREDYLALIEDVTAAITSSLDLDHTLEAIVRRTAEVLEVFECNLYEYLPETDCLVASAVWGQDLSEEELAWVGTELKLSDHPEYRPIMTDRAIVQFCADDPDLPAEERAQMDEWGERAYISAPLEFQGSVIGCLDLVERREVRHFTDEEREVLRRLSVPAAIALHNARMFRRVEEQNRYLRSLLDSSRVITATVDLDEVLARVTREACETVGCPVSVLYVYDVDRDALVYQTRYDSRPRPTDAFLGEAYPLADCPGDGAILSSPTIVVEHVSDASLPPDRRKSLETWGEQTVVSVPLRFQNQSLGVLRLYEVERERTYTALELEYLSGLGELAGSALHNAQSFRREQARAVELETLLEASKSMASSMVIDEILQHLSERAAVALGASQCLIYEYDPERNTTSLRASFAQPGVDVSGDDPCGTEFSLEDYPNDLAIMAGGVPVEDHIQDPGLAEDVRESMLEFGYGTCLTAPIIFRGEPLGTMELIVMGDGSRRFSASEIELAKGLTELAGSAIHNAQSYGREQTRGLELETLLEATKAMASSMELEDVLGQLAQRAAVALGSPQCLIYEHDAEHDALILRSTFDVHGVDPDDVDRVGNVYPLADYPSDRETLRRGEVVEEHISDADTAADVRASMEEYGEKACLTVPLVFRGRALGLMELIEKRHERHFTASEMRLARALADQAAIALNNARLYRRSQEYAARLETSYLETVTALAAAMEAKDHYTADHADMLAMMAVAVGRRLGLNERELRDVQFASVLHDIGKIGIPGHILNKPDKLTDEEFAVMAEHTIIGERIISAIDYLAPIGKAIRAAHERWDGRGYPDGLSGETIPRPARILFVCDAFHAMTSDRPYRKALPDEAALEELRGNAGRQFDPEVVAAFLEVWPHFEGAEVAPRTLHLD